MNTVTPEFIERYQKIFEQDPSSRVFAPLAEAYRKLGKLDRAFEICRRGVAHHPSFASGHVALAKILLDQKKLSSAAESLNKAIKLAPENILAHNLLAQIWVDLRKPKDALRSFKMVLLLNPNDQKAKKSVQRLESLTADEYDEETFQMGRIGDFSQTQQNDSQSGNSRPSDFFSKYLNQASGKASTTADKIRGLERVLTLVDALLIRNEFDRALNILTEAKTNFGNHPEIDQRLSLIQGQQGDTNQAHESIEPEDQGLELRPKNLGSEEDFDQPKDLLSNQRLRQVEAQQNIDIADELAPINTRKDNRRRAKIDKLQTLLKKFREKRLMHA